MAGGKIIRITGGKSTTECESWTVYCENFNISAGGTSTFTADGGTNFGEPEDPPSGKKYFEKGWWTDKDGKEIKEAKLGDKVQFHLKMRNVFPLNSWENEKVQLQLREFDGSIPNILLYLVTFGIADVKAHDKINLVVKNEDGKYTPFTELQITPNMEMVIHLTLEEDAFINLIKNDYDYEREEVIDKDIELYFNFTYYSARENETESADLPIMEWNYLVVKPPQVVEPIIFVEASDTHKLPAIYSAEDGSPWYVNVMSPEAYKEIKGIKEQAEEVAENIEMIGNFFKENGGGTFEPEKMNDWTKRSYEIAIRKLNKGELIFTDGSKGVTNRFHRYRTADIDGRFSQEVMMGVNRGKFKKGVTSKAINQLEAQANRGVAKVFKTVGELNPLWDAICDVADILVAAANGERPPLPFTPPFVTDYIDRYFDEMYEDLRERWKNDLFKSVIKGKVATKDFLNENPYKDTKSLPSLGFQLIELSEEGIRKILTKEVNCVNDKTNPKIPIMLEALPNIGEGSRDAGILVQSLENEDKYGRLTKHHYIHAIFIKDLVV